MYSKKNDLAHSHRSYSTGRKKKKIKYLNTYTAAYQIQISDLFLLGAMGELDLQQSVFVFMRTIILSFPAAQKKTIFPEELREKYQENMKL